MPRVLSLPVRPPLKPMLGRLVRELPRGEFVYEPKWDGFRCLAFCAGDEVELHSRHERPLGRYFPELVDALGAVENAGFVLDGEILMPTDGGYDFTTLMERLHPAASRVELLSRRNPAAYVAFDLLARGGRDLREEPFSRRRAELEDLLADASDRVRLTPASTDPATASEWLAGATPGIDGVMAKERQLTYRSGQRAMFKVKLERTLDCVLGGFRLLADRPLPSSLLLGLYDETGRLEHIGVAGGFSERLRHELVQVLGPIVVPLSGHPWERGFLLTGSPLGRLKGAAGRWAPQEMELDWIPVSPTHVVEVSYDHLEAGRLRHPARFRRWRPDRDPRSCTFDQV